MNNKWLILLTVMVGVGVIGGVAVSRIRRLQKATQEQARVAQERERAAAARETRCKPVLSNLTNLWVQHRPQAVEGSLEGMNVLYCYQEIYFPTLCGLFQECVSTCGGERCSNVGEAVGASLAEYFHGAGAHVCENFPASHLSADKMLRQYCAEAIGVTIK